MDPRRLVRPGKTALSPKGARGSEWNSNSPLALYSWTLPNEGRGESSLGWRSLAATDRRFLK
jgi:hypothetical protein